MCWRARSTCRCSCGKMASSLTPSASTNPFSTRPEEEEEVLRRNCPSPHNPFSLPARASSPGNPLVPPTSPPATPTDKVLPFSDVCELMQPIKLEDMFPELEGNPHPTTTSDSVAATWSATDHIADMPELVENACTTTTSSATNDFIATYVSSSDFAKTHTSNSPEIVHTNHVADGSSSGISTWGNNTNNSNHAERTEGDGFGEGFQDDFGSLSHTDVIFKTGFMDNSFKAVAVTAEEDDLWSSSFIMEDPPPDGEKFQSSGDQETTEQGAETSSQTELGIHFDSFQTSGETMEVEKQNIGLSNTQVHLEIDLPNFANEPWDPWSPEDVKDLDLVHNQSTSHHVLDPWAPSDQTSEQSQRTENSQAYGVEDVFSLEGADPWGIDTVVDAGKERGREVDMFGQDPWTPFESTKEDVDQNTMRPQTLELSASFGNPFSSEASIDSSLQQGSSPFHDDRSSPFHHQLNPTSYGPDASQSLFPGTSQLKANAFRADNDPWSPSLTLDNQEGSCSRGSRSPNPFSPVEDSANPFLQDLDLLPGKLGRVKQSKIPDIPKFEEENSPSTSNSKKEGASTSAIMEGAAADPQVFSNGTDTLDVADHDDIFDMNGSAEVTQTDDEFENNERMMEEEEEDTKKGFGEVEDIFQNDNHVTDAADVENANISKEKEEVEDIFGDDLHVKEEPDYEPIFTADARKEEPVIKITDADTEKLEPEVSLKVEVNLDNEAEASELDADLPFPDMPRKSDISLNWEDVMEEEQQKQQQQQSCPPTPPSANINAPPTNVDAPPTSTEEQEEEIDEGEVAKFVEKILISSMNEVSSQAEEQESESQIENVVEVEVSEPAVEAPETTVESDNVLSLEIGPKKVDVDVVDEPAEKGDVSVSVEALAGEHADISGLAKDQNGGERELEINTDVPISVGEAAKEVQDVVQERPPTDFKDTLVLDLKDSPAVESSSALEKTEERSKSPDTPLSMEVKTEVEVTKNVDSSEGRQRKMSVPRPRDVRKDLSEARPSFFGSNTAGPKPFMSNTLPRVSVLPRISTSYQRKSPTSPMSFSGDYSSSFDKDSEELPKELPTVAGPDLSKDDTQVIKELGTIELPHIEALSKPSSPKAATVASAKVDVNPVVPAKDTKVESGPMAPVYAHRGAGKDPIVLDGTSPEEIEAIFAKDPEEEPKKKSMGKDDVMASTRVRKVSRTTWKGQDEFQRSVEKSAVVLDEPQAASLRKYEERRKQRIEGFTGKYRTREDSTSEAESEGSQSSQSGPKMPDVVQSGGSVSSQVNPESEVVAPKLNMKSVRSLWEQKAAEVEQRRRSLQTKSRPVSQGEKYRPSNSKNIKSCDGSENLDDSIEGSTTYSYDGTSDDGSVKRESLIERDIRLQKERDLEITKERDRLRSESTSSRDESQQSETSETQDDQVVDIVRDAELRRDSDDGRSSPSQSSGYTSGRSTPSTPAGDDILKAKTGKSSGKTPELKMSLSPTDPDASSNYKEYQKALRNTKSDKFSKSATFPRRMENFEKQAESSGISPTNSVGDVPDVIMVDGNKSTSPSDEKPRKASIVQQGIKLSQKLEKKKIAKLEKKPRRSLMELEIAAQREKEEAFRREQQTRKMSTSKSVGDEAQPASSTSSTTTSPSTTPQSSPRKTSFSGPTAKQVYKDLNYAPQTNKKKLALAGHWEHKWK